MKRSGYELLGFAVWHGAKWYVRRRYGWLVPSRRVVAAGVVGGAIVAIAVAESRRESAAAGA
ncbi:hypothetical protein GKE82_03575 [Conexibacter sp. W3-3-2]|uniref:Uncharacterized protein n=1 Tax=Paraconexibacter algicola TaxID=2133960 RepID=A0A2T4UB93_9ACTN|nr:MULTISPECIES: hypothetical protein [Solirubrobacterales]MTD43406.1 hypothetical protein [Conexibacter sp. W3-3-2]PTL54118.1 hypothetical protein C7Y72_22150 [Paraconexibacter algicola]